MKKNRIISLLGTALVLVLGACQPIDDREVLESRLSIDDIKLTSSQATEGGNLIELSMETPGVTGYWDYNLGKALTNKFEFIYPIPGKNTFTYVGTLGSEFFTKTIEVQVDVLDHELNQDWYDLVGTDTEAGKTWVFNGGPEPDGKMWWYMAPGNDPSQWETAWWNAGGDCCPPADAAGRMTFDLDGAANFTYYAQPDATPEVASFVLDPAKQTLKIEGGNILGGAEQGNPDGLYTIVSLTEDELILYVPNNAGGTGWVWVFKPEE